MTNKISRNATHVMAIAKVGSNIYKEGDCVIFDKDDTGWHITQINDKMNLYNPAFYSFINDNELFDILYQQTGRREFI